MELKSFSPKQLTALCWWCETSPHRDKDAIICDGAVRSGKTLSLSLGFVLWAMSGFHGQDFAICGKTIPSVRRNLLYPLLDLLQTMDYRCEWKPSQNLFTVRQGSACNRFHLFGGRDEGAAALIQGATLAGVLLDEVALMPRSFVEQALARCSVPGSKFWFNCNPEHPGHWFHREWITQADAKNALYLHFTMDDNPALPPEILQRYKSLYSGVFYQRYVLGKWCAAHGAVYPMFDSARHVVQTLPGDFSRHVLSCDYGTLNPASFGLWGECGGVWYRMREFYHDGRESGKQLTDEQYADALLALKGDLAVEAIIVDPSAASFIQCLRSRGLRQVLPADNQVLDGVRRVAALLEGDKLRFHQSCAAALREFGLYRWDMDAIGDTPRKEHDHAMDDIRYFASYLTNQQAHGFAAVAATTRRGTR